MKRILITGVTGFVGFNLVEDLWSNFDCVLFGHSRDSIKAKNIFKHHPVQFVENYSDQVLDEFNIDTVIHLAGIAHDLNNKYKSSDYYEVNYENTKLLFNYFVKSRATNFFFLSSIKAAVDVSTEIVDEQVDPAPITVYGKSKLKAEQYLQSVPLPESKKVYIFRPCMIHGRGNKGNLNLLYRFAKSRLPYPFGAFQNQRSFLNMGNLSFIFRIFLTKDIPSGIYHLADKGFISTTELYKIIAEVLGNKPKIWNLPKWFVRLVFSVLGKRAMLNKLTEDMKVSNQKFLQYANYSLPLDIREELKDTIRSFHGT
jgi:nucleoside-diphosphate-sugar epimerase